MLCRQCRHRARRRELTPPCGRRACASTGTFILNVSARGARAVSWIISLIIAASLRSMQSHVVTNQNTGCCGGTGKRAFWRSGRAMGPMSCASSRTQPHRWQPTISTSAFSRPLTHRVFPPFPPPSPPLLVAPLHLDTFACTYLCEKIPLASFWVPNDAITAQPCSLAFGSQEVRWILCKRLWAVW